MRNFRPISSELPWKERIMIGATFAKLLKEARVVSRKYAKTAARAESARDSLQKKVDTLIAVCKPHCLEAVKKYNRSAFLRIMSEHLTPYFSASHDQLSLHVRLNYPNGNEPNEELSVDDVALIAHSLRPLIENEFRKARMSLSFGGITVPMRYYKSE